MVHLDLKDKLAAIETELRRLGFLRGDITPVDGVTSAFGSAQMTFEHWLGHAFLPQALNAAESGDLPKSSEVGVAAMRNFDGLPEADELVSLLTEFDERVKILARLGQHPPYNRP
jgi:uncharacterized protein YqcC (DUF446 family)